LEGEKLVKVQILGKLQDFKGDFLREGAFL
jgi:hypothetical protein